MEEFDKFYNKALKFLSYRPRSEKEIVDKLRTKKAPEEIIDKVIKKLKEYKFLDDDEFARVWIQSRVRSGPRSWKTILFELKKKGVSDEIAQVQISNFKNQTPDEEMAKILLEKRIHRLKNKNLSKEKKYQKLGMFLASKGFDWGTIKKSIDEILNKKV